MGKLFGKEKKQDDTSAATLDAFLRSSTDHLDFTNAPSPPPPPSMPKLAKLDTTISRYPQALAVNQQAQQNRPMAPGKFESRQPRKNPGPNRKGMTVRFTDSYPEIIGDGGDESELPVVEIGKNKRRLPPPLLQPTHTSPRPPSARPAVPPRSPGQQPSGPYGPDLSSAADDFRPKPLARTQTGYSSIYDDEETPSSARKPVIPGTWRDTENNQVPVRAASGRYLETVGRRDEQRRSFIETHQAQMREAEGQAFVRAARSANGSSHLIREDDAQPSATPADDSPDSSRRYTPSPGTRTKQPALDYSPAASISSDISGAHQHLDAPQINLPLRQSSAASMNGHDFSHLGRATSPRPHDAVDHSDDEALGAFVERTKHLFELFRLHAETVRPLSKCEPLECARAALWWFLKGRMALEVAVRERPNSPQAQMQNELDRQQAYSNLSKGYWLCQEAVPEIMDANRFSADAQVTAVSQSLLSALRKLAQSMKRNGFLPPEEPFLPQTIDKSIWLNYPALSQDLLALLSGNWASSLTTARHPTTTIQLLDALPLGDTADHFNYGRVVADVFLSEQGRESQRIFLPCILSMVRPQNSTELIFIIASQDGSVQLTIQDGKTPGPAWNDVQWSNKTCAVEIRLPRGFLLVLQLNQNDYRMLWNMYDFGAKVRTSLHPRSDEAVVFRNTLRSFQYLDSDPQSRMFPKEPVPLCELALFERIYKEPGPTSPRHWHCGFRVAVVTGSRTRTLSGVQHSFLPPVPVQFGFFRAEGEAPGLSLRYANERQRGRMVLVFGDDKDRIKFHSLLTGSALGRDEKVFAHAPLKSFTISQSLREPFGIAPFSRMPWKAATVVNDEFSLEGDAPPTVLANNLKVVLEYQNGTVADRVNVAPGELRLRLDVSNAKVLRVLRQPQRDLTVSVSEAQVPKELPSNLADALQLVKGNQTIRTFEFNNLQDLHCFQAALTGFEVIFDALAVTFAIARRRMVVPIHKKWEAGYTRIQVVRMEDKQIQLLAFFEDFQHGHCMNFVLKGTDVYESFQRGSKAGIRFVDAKFPLPQLPADKDGDYDDMAFVCLDLPDLPGEHDDVSIMFEDEAGKLCLWT